MIHLKSLRKMFPYLSDKNKMSKLKIDKESLYSISLKDDAEKISSLISYNLKKLKLDPSKITITDATAGVGGNTISFAKIFKFVNSIEIDKLRASYLENNLSIYDIKNCKIYNDDCTNAIKLLDYDIIFFDPPWGGRDYKNHHKIRLQLSNIDIEDICNDLLFSGNYKQNPFMVILKLPLNYDVQYIYDKITQGYIYLYVIKRMQIIIIIKSVFNIE